MRVVAPAPPRQEAPDSAELREATKALYREHYDFVWRNARRLGCSDDWVDDAVHEVFLVVGRRLSEFEHRAHERTWLFAITFRVVQRMRRDRARQRGHLDRYRQERPAATADAASESEAAQYLRYLLAQLPEAQRAVLILAELEGFTSAEIAATLGVPAGTVDTRLRAAKTALSRAVERERLRHERLSR
jgi:RNA polymerase sigma-70 factor, ECF subfamily